ncbi:DUF6602 domain-containing protein [Xanthomonas vasicola]|uniref:DUF6602 domain-containing protein n=1 Tax=Xanthomonas vasicola TaxID=56459 RepID=UPI000531F300|nr:DUF6602 domain-containing protein [Xanthomonas vasicola]AZR35191.1 hypothetical protein NX08_012635 [Xanthomonas vasicola]AZR36450.1 hypothetical protein NX08_020475 [Xanthomonas vasicola]KGR54833.1 hypothetical protein NX07_03340 [Xanthomonas vasicola]KGR56091.1 hypothetical protein NX09_09770 [Xanthomonas vasicola]KGT85493.1 hypothetical protein OC00_02575 [Xanthomonas vasicola]
MLKSHMDARENALVAISRIPANSGHSLHKGTPREAFIREFLQSHLPENVAIGTGEIIDANSQPGAQRNQFDIVIYKKNYPKLDFGGGVSGFLIESVIATVEVKSTLDQAGMAQAISAAKNSKALTPNVTSSFQSGYIPPKVLSYVVAYDGPASMQTAYNWITQTHSSLGILIPDLPQDGSKRLMTASPSIDGVFILNRGFIYFDNVPVGFAISSTRANTPSLKWVFADASTGNLLLLFLLLQSATANIEGKWLRAANKTH